MTTGMTVALLAVLVVTAFVIVGLTGLRTWRADRQDQRRYLHEQGLRWGPDGSRAAGDAWRSIVGDGPPAMRLRARGLTAETSTTAEPPNREM